MQKQHILLPLFVIMAAIGILHHFALANFWYWTIWWIDVVMHTLGGVVLGLAALWFLLSVHRVQSWPPRRVFVVVLGVVFAVGVAWEFFEFFAKLFVQGHFFPDTVLDIFADVAGGLVAFAYYLGLHPKDTLTCIS
ncbi:hypothetical protein L0Y40_02780 [Candidatus Wolfebacteria bacterium]|nr:hypothetical protein [Candidatus Wolfebacteria bacterium]